VLTAQVGSSSVHHVGTFPQIGPGEQAGDGGEQP
jgi:hypothetical protein